jgi:hypothetical protein
MQSNSFLVFMMAPRSMVFFYLPVRLWRIAAGRGRLTSVAEVVCR